MVADGLVRRRFGRPPRQLLASAALPCLCRINPSGQDKSHSTGGRQHRRDGRLPRFPSHRDEHVHRNSPCCVSRREQGASKGPLFGLSSPRRRRPRRRSCTFTMVAGAQPRGFGAPPSGAKTRGSSRFAVRDLDAATWRPAAMVADRWPRRVGLVGACVCRFILAVRSRAGGPDAVHLAGRLVARGGVEFRSGRRRFGAASLASVGLIAHCKKRYAGERSRGHGGKN